MRFCSESKLEKYRVRRRLSLSTRGFTYCIQQRVRKYFQDGSDTFYADMWEVKKDISKVEYYELRHYKKDKHYQEMLAAKCKVRKILNEETSR